MRNDREKRIRALLIDSEGLNIYNPIAVAHLAYGAGFSDCLASILEIGVEDADYFRLPKDKLKIIMRG